MTDQERREKARRIAEAYCRITGHVNQAMVELQAYDKLCWAEAMAEVNEEFCCPHCKGTDYSCHSCGLRKRGDDYCRS